MELIKFIFSSFWHFIGALILLELIVDGFYNVIVGIVGVIAGLKAPIQSKTDENPDGDGKH